MQAQDFSLDVYRSMFSVVSQDPYLFLGSIMENIDLQGNATQEDIEAALHASRVDSYLKRMPNGVNTKIGVNGAKLSGGEKQKLAVARALLKDAPIIILDEATSGFDVESRRYLHDVIMHEMKGKTVIMITHHYENLKGIDRIYKLENGLLLPYNTAVEGGKE